MISKKRIFKYSAIVLGIITIPAVALTGFYVIGNADRFRQFSISPQNDSTNGLITAYRAAIFAGAELIMAPGFTHNVPIVTAIENEPKVFDKTGFLLFDDVVPSESPAALQTFNITYRVDLGSLETGLAAAYFLNTNQETFITKDDPNLTYSMWGGLTYSSVTSFMGGLQKGVDWANKELHGKKIPQVDGTSKTYLPVIQEHVEVREENPTASHFTGGFGPSDGQQLQQNIINLESDLIMPVAGPQVFNAQTLIQSGRNSSLLLGVDSAVEDDPRNGTSLLGVGNNKIVQFSSLKNLRISGNTALELVNNGNRVPVGEDKTNSKYNGFLVENPDTPGEMIGGLGVSSIGNITNKSVGVSEVGKKYSDAAMELLDPIIAPWLDPFYSIGKNMFYDMDPSKAIEGVPGAPIYYGSVNGDGSSNPYGIRQEPKLNIPTGSNYSDVLNLKDFVTLNEALDSNKIKIVLSSALSILLDASFSQSCYLAFADFMKNQGINVPYPNGFSPPDETN